MAESLKSIPVVQVKEDNGKKHCGPRMVSIKGGLYVEKRSLNCECLASGRHCGPKLCKLLPTEGHQTTLDMSCVRSPGKFLISPPLAQGEQEKTLLKLF